jgi:hypothetical protein
MAYPGSSFVSALELFAGMALVLGVALSLGRNRLELWKLPALSGGVLLVLRLSWLFDADWADFRATLPVHLAAVVGFPAGMLAGGALVAAIRARRARG